MKTLLIVVGFSILTWNAIEDLPLKQTEIANHYCVILKDGILVVVHQGNAIQSDVTLTNGTIIKVDGTIIKKDGTKVVMAVNECADEEGNRITTDKTEKIQQPK